MCPCHWRAVPAHPLEEGLSQEDKGKEKLHHPGRRNALSFPGSPIEELGYAHGTKNPAAEEAVPPLTGVCCRTEFAGRPPVLQFCGDSIFTKQGPSCHFFSGCTTVFRLSRSCESWERCCLFVFICCTSIYGITDCIFHSRYAVPYSAL